MFVFPDILKAKAFRSVMSRFKVLCSWDHISKYDHMSDDNSLQDIALVGIAKHCSVNLCQPFAHSLTFSFLVKDFQ